MGSLRRQSFSGDTARSIRSIPAVPMRIGAFQIDIEPDSFDEPHCIASLRPWINVGNVGRIVLSRLGKMHQARKVGYLARPSRFYDFTRYRPRVRLIDGERNFYIPNTTVWGSKMEDGPDLLFLHLLEPHAFAEDFNESVLQLLRTFGVTRYVLVGSMYDGVPHTRPLRVSGAARGWRPGPDFARAVRLSQSRYQGPTSFVSQLTEEVRTRLDLETLSMIVHLPLYLKLDDDYAGAASILTALGHVYGMSPYEFPEVAAGRTQYDQVGYGSQIDPRMSEVIAKFESDYDEEVGVEDDTVDGSEPIELLPEVEQFLQDVAEQMHSPDEDEGPEESGRR